MVGTSPSTSNWRNASMQLVWKSACSSRLGKRKNNRAFSTCQASLKIGISGRTCNAPYPAILRMSSNDDQNTKGTITRWMRGQPAIPQSYHPARTLYHITSVSKSWLGDSYFLSMFDHRSHNSTKLVLIIAEKKQVPATYAPWL